MSGTTTVSTVEMSTPSQKADLSLVLEDWDIGVIVAYFVAVILVGIWSSWRSKKDSVSGYFLASRSMHWIPVGASLFASNIGSGHFIGLAGSGAATGIAIAGFELNAVFVLMILAWVFVPVYVASGVYTMPEYLRKRFGGQRIRIYLSVLTLLLYVFTKISADLFAGAIFIQQALNWDLYASAGALLLIACIFTAAGGLNAVIWTDLIQTILMVAGAFYLMVLSIIRVGGYEKIISDFPMVLPENTDHIEYDPHNNNATCFKVPENYNHLIRSPDDHELPWTGMFFGITVSAVWYWCSDQVIVQRALSARDMSHVKAGCIMAGYLKILPLYLLVIPGMAARILFKDEVGCASPQRCYDVCQSRSGCSNIAYPMLVTRLMPIGARGLMLSVMLAALMSSLTSIFNSASTIFTIDIWKKFRKQAKDVELVIVGRFFVIVLVGVSIAWIPIIQNFPNSQLFHYIQSITSFLAPPVCAVYVLAISSKRINESGAFWGLMIGLVIGLIRFIWEITYSVPECGSTEPDPRPAVITSMHYLHFGILLFVISLINITVISWMTAPIDEKHLHRLTFASRFSKEKRIDLTKRNLRELQNGEAHKPSATSISGQINQAYLPESKDQIPMNDIGYSIPEDYNTTSYEEPSGFKKAIYMICCVRSAAAAEEEEPPAYEPEVIEDLLVEKPLWRKVCNINAVILLMVGTFMWGFYA